METEELVAQAAARVEMLTTENKALAKKSTDLEARIADLEKKAAADRGGGGRIVGAPVNYMQALGASPGFEAFVRGGATNSGRIALPNLSLRGIMRKALTTFDGSPESPQTGLGTARGAMAGLFGIPFRPLRLLDTLRHVPMGTGSITYNRISVSGGAAVQQGEGVEKAEADITATPVVATAQTVAVHTTISKQALADSGSLELEIGTLLEYLLMDKVEREFITGPGGQFALEGLLVFASLAASQPTYTREERIGAALAAMEGAGYQPDLVLVNPVTWWDVRRLKSNVEGTYVMQGPTVAGPQVLWDTPVVKSAAVPQGSALLVDSRYVVILDRMNPTLLLSSEHASNFTENLVTILAEWRGQIALLDEAAAVLVDLDAASSGG